MLISHFTAVINQGLSGFFAESNTFIAITNIINSWFSIYTLVQLYTHVIVDIYIR